MSSDDGESSTSSLTLPVPMKRPRNQSPLVRDPLVQPPLSVYVKITFYSENVYCSRVEQTSARKSLQFLVDSLLKSQSQRSFHKAEKI